MGSGVGWGQGSQAEGTACANTPCQRGSPRLCAEQEGEGIGERLDHRHWGQKARRTGQGGFC